MVDHIPNYISSKQIADEARRLSLMGRLANHDLSQVLEKLNLDTKLVDSVLDVGCGTGEAFTVFSRYFPDSKIVGVDASQKALEVADELGIATRLILGDARDLSSLIQLQEYRPFAISYIRNTLIHIPEMEMVLAEMKRLTQEGGLVIAQEADWEPAWGNFADFDIFKKSLTEMMRTNNINPYVGQRLKQAFAQIGLSDLHEIRLHTLVKGVDEEWEIMELLVEVAGERLLPFLQQHDISSLGELKSRLRVARDKPDNTFCTPDWVVVYGKVD